ncbi:response regulator [Tanticharoenia sakaeratensis]|uniref:Response regulator receiver n=1 Tax=Tanticharoenia sakaeratensis NBRC 103193 TaxID=1231623 RepID=A0A0D6MPS1_9PROT|nr:response regulator [Tanticharoenia sakaeratensis]GAN55268.1 response regulator receiver [Tanticharoenia sakaeratensis NBRC 103193]GBQ23397.1 two component response regulator [Tanticharoenia sakaeratensis NBRC 103193]
MSDVMDVLIVEDEMLIVMDMEALVEDSGNQVIAHAASADDVEGLPDTINPTLAFVDIQLANGSSGLDACKVIQRRWPDALIVFMTANVSLVPKDFLGAHGVIAKPYSHAGVANSLKYLSEGVFDPPPTSPRPTSLRTSPHLDARWAAGGSSTNAAHGA